MSALGGKFEDAIWDEWFDSQYELNVRIRRAIDGLSQGKDRVYTAALWSSVIEQAAEQIRTSLDPKEVPE